MKVKDMIEMLQKVKPDIEIMVYDPDAHGYEPGNDLSFFKAEQSKDRPYWFLAKEGTICVEICHDPEKA